MIRIVALCGLVALATGAGGAVVAAATSTPVAEAGRPVAAVRYAAPVPEPLTVVRRFDPPATPYGAGHLGVDLGVRKGALVRSAAAGVVTFAGQVAGRGVVVVLHADGIRTEYEPVRASVRTGTNVRRSQSIGTVVGTHRGCPGRCLHWGARRGEAYVDPLGLLRPLGPVVLLPWLHPGVTGPP